MVHEVRHVLLAFSQGHYLPGSLMNMQTSIPFVDSALLLGKTWKSDELCDRGIGLPARYSRVLAELPWLIYCLCSPTSAPCSCMHVYSVQVHEKLRQAPIFTCNLQKPWHSFLRWYSVKYFQNNWRGQTNLSQISYQQHVRDYKLDPDPRQIWFTTMHQLQVVRTALGCPKKGGKNPILKTGTGFSLSAWARGNGSKHTHGHRGRSQHAGDAREFGASSGRSWVRASEIGGSSFLPISPWKDDKQIGQGNE